MREILFRGKRINNGEWVRGNLFVSETDGRTYILAGSRRFTIEWEVDQETVGQFTCLTDKNGKRILEGAIISIPYEADRAPVEGTFIHYENGKVYFDETHFGWYVKFVGDELSLWEFDDCGVEVIGNIHDNPDLLEVHND